MVVGARTPAGSDKDREKAADCFKDQEREDIIKYS